MKKTNLIVVLLASLMFGACSSDSDSDNSNAAYTEAKVSETPEWQINWRNNQERPDWSKPDASLYENWTTLMVQIEETLLPYVSDDDLMALFVNDELRGLAKPAVALDNKKGSSKFLMKAYGNETGSETVDMSLKYYSHQLKHIFTLTERLKLDSDVSMGTDEDFIPQFTLGSAKYPVVKTVTVEPVLTKAGLTPLQDNMVGAFVDEECRGEVTLSAAGSTPLVIYGRNAGESVTLKYYDGTKGKVYTIADAIKL